MWAAYATLRPSEVHYDYIPRRIGHYVKAREWFIDDDRDTGT
jgi:hypothetical protein